MSELKEPTRLIESEPSSKVGQLMLVATQELPSDPQLAELRERLESVLRPGADVDLRPSASAWVKVALTTGVAAVLAGGVFALRPRALPDGARSVPVVPSPASVLSAAASESAAPVPGVSAEATTERVAASANAESSSPLQRSAAESRKAGSVAAQAPSESGLLERARRVLNSDPGTALALTNQATKLFPNGVLVQEREVIAIAALRALNRTSEAEHRAASFSKAFPGSAHERAIEDAPPR